MNAEAADIMAAARMQVYSRHPYLSTVLFALRPCEANGLGTLAVDEGWRLYYDPEVVLRWQKEAEQGRLNRIGGSDDYHDGVAGVVFHELGHVLREHFKRRGERDPACWNKAGDREINDDVIAAGWRLPGSALLPADIGKANGLLAEEYYYDHGMKSQSCEAAPGCGGTCGGAAGNPTAWERENAGDSGRAAAGGEEGRLGDSPLPDPVDPLDQDISLRKTAQDIASHIKARGKGSVPAGLQAWSELRLEPPKVDWRKRLAGLARQALAATAGCVDFTWRKVGRRSLHSAGRAGWPILPAYHQPIPKVVFVLDTSGSMSGGRGERSALEEALSEVVGIVRTCGADCWGVACDAQAYAPARIGSLDDLKKLNQGGGGTDMRPGFTAALTLKPDVVVILTDGLVGDDWPGEAECRRARVLAAIVAGTGEKAPPWIPSVEVE